MNQRAEEDLKREAMLEKAMYKVWLAESGETNEMWIRHLRNCLRVALEEDLTPTQKRYLGNYMSGYNMYEIAGMYGVNISTVSRTISRGINRLLSRIKYATPRTLHAEKRVRKCLKGMYK